MDYPILIINKKDKEEYLHIGNGFYIPKWKIIYNQPKIPLPISDFDVEIYDLYYLNKQL